MVAKRSKLAWTFKSYGTSEDFSKQGIAIFDIETQTSIMLTPYDIINYESSRPHMVWNRAESHIVVWHYQSERDDFVWDMISLDGSFSQTLKGSFGQWNTDSNLYTISLYDEQEKIWLPYIKSIDGTVDYHFCCGLDNIWSPDGKQLLLISGGRDKILADRGRYEGNRAN